MASSRPRFAVIDALRGVAILAMIVFHVAWDLYWLSLIDVDVISSPGWIAFQRGIVTSFLLLVGAGLVLGHGEATRWHAFWRRETIIVGAAMLTTIGTYIVFPDYFVFFGILHAIALFSLMALPFLRARLWVAIGVALLVIIPPGLITSPVMTQKGLSWIGFWPVPPETTDVVPIFPWFGVVLLGIAGMRLLRPTALWERVRGWELRDPIGRVLLFAGRWSLVIYLVHQPLIYGGLSLIAPPLAVVQ